MEHDGWSPVIAQIERDHYGDREAVARALSVALIGDDKDWRQHWTNASRFMAEMKRTMPKIQATLP